MSTSAGLESRECGFLFRLGMVLTAVRNSKQISCPL